MEKRKIGIDWLTEEKPKPIHSHRECTDKYENNHYGRLQHDLNHNHKWHGGLLDYMDLYCWADFEMFDPRCLQPDTEVTIFGIDWVEECLIKECFFIRKKYEEYFYESENGYTFREDEWDTISYSPLFIKINKKELIRY